MAIRIRPGTGGGSALALLVLVVGCATPRPKAAQGGSRIVAVPAQCVEAVERAKVLGRALLHEDLIAWWGTDVALAGGADLEDRRTRQPRGWITTHNSSGWEVHFLREVEGQLVEAYRVTFDRFDPGAGKLTAFDPPRAADPETALLFAVRAVALREAPPERCTETYNFAILPGAIAGEQGWFVYLLPSTRDVDDWVVGGQIRRLVSEDGKKVLRSEQMSKQCGVIGPSTRKLEKGATLEAVSVTNLAWPCPTEIHVWLSLHHKKPMFVGTRLGLWQVDGEDIKAFECQECGDR